LPYEKIYSQKRRIKKLKKAHRKAKRSNAHAAYKINAVTLLGIGWTLSHVRQALLLDGETLRSYVKKYREDGIKGLIATHYKGRPQSSQNHKKIN
jgi:transposase